MSKPFRSDKRKKELLRLKKQEEKRQRRFNGKQEDGTIEGEVAEMDGEAVETEGTALEGEQPEGIIAESGPSETEKKIEDEK